MTSGPIPSPAITEIEKAFFVAFSEEVAAARELAFFGGDGLGIIY
jgi:hypothetical protein